MTTSPSIVEARANLERYVAMRTEKPILHLDDVIHGVHSDSEWEAELRLSDLRALLAETRGDEGFSSFGANAPSSGTEQSREPVGGLPAQLMADAELLLAWDRFELGDPAPGPLSHRAVAARLTLAAQRLMAWQPKDASPPSREPAGDMVERVARALDPASWRTYDEIGCKPPPLTKARAAIAAMAEPTEAMLRASPIVGHGPDERGAWAINTRPAQEIWAAMIRAALSPAVEGGE